MISKERLEELIEQGAVLYTFTYYKDGTKDAVPFNPVMSYYIDKDCLRYKYGGNIFIKFQDLYETKEEAEFVMKYKNIQRTETLDLPTWEEMQRVSKFGMFAMSFLDKKGHYCELSIMATIKVTVYEYGLMIKYENSATKENYLKACEIAKKLFLGEEV